MRQANYFAATDTLSGDFRLCKDLRQMFLSLGIEYPARYDGISRWMRDDGALVTRIIIKDFFSTKPSAFFVQDL